MPITGFQHVNVRASDVDASRDFYVGVLGLSAGDRPPFASKGYWLYAGDSAVIHLVQRKPGEARGAGSGCIDHIGLAATGLAATRQLLIDKRIQFVEQTLPPGGTAQIFVDDPDGVRIELNFG